MRLICAGLTGKSRKWPCNRTAAWAVTNPIRPKWTGACGTHLHQVIRAVGGHARAEVIPADRLDDEGNEIINQTGLLRQIVSDGTSWHYGQVKSALEEAGVEHVGAAWVRDQLHSLTETGYLTRVGGPPHAPTYALNRDNAAGSNEGAG